MIVLDDFFSALDGETEKNIFDNLFGREGTLRRNDVTTILVSNSRMLSLPIQSNLLTQKQLNFFQLPITSWF